MRKKNRKLRRISSIYESQQTPEGQGMPQGIREKVRDMSNYSGDHIDEPVLTKELGEKKSRFDGQVL